ncbi:unnamed protein product [Urochloa humidicola]
MTAGPDDADSNDDAIIDIAEAIAGAPGLRDCLVCTEPAEWVVVGPCGHGEVCVACAVRLRFHERNWQCCICRAFCPTVVVTRNAASGGQLATIKAVAAYFDNGMAAYFDDEGQYEKAWRMCLEPDPSLLAAGANRSLQAPPQDQEYSRLGLVVLFLILATIITLIGCGTGALVAMSMFGNWRKRIPVVIAGGFLFDAIAYLFWKC